MMNAEIKAKTEAIVVELPLWNSKKSLNKIQNLFIAEKLTMT